jgi:hypothetical protein
MTTHDVFICVGSVATTLCLKRVVHFIRRVIAALRYERQREHQRRRELELGTLKGNLFVRLPSPIRPWSEPAVKGFLRGDR